MKIEKKKLRQIIQEEIEKDLVREFESKEARRDRYTSILTDDNPDNDNQVPDDFKKGFNLIKKPLDAAAAALRGEGESSEGDIEPADATQVE